MDSAWSSGSLGPQQEGRPIHDQIHGSVRGNSHQFLDSLYSGSSCCWTDDANCLSQLHCCQHHNDLIFDLCVKDHWSAWQWMNIEITSGKKTFSILLFSFFLNWDACIMYMCIKLLTCICSCIVVRR